MKPFLSVVVPLYNEEMVIDALYSRLTKVLNKVSLEFEVIMVNDGSYDGTSEKAKTICEKDRRFKLISFSRNFGHQIAITAGMDKASGKVIVVIDADLQDPPELIPNMIEKWREGYQVVYGKRKKRKGESLFKVLTASAFYRLLRKVTPIDIPLDTGDFRLLDARVVRELKRMRERNRFVRGMVSWIGFKQTEVEYVREKRFAGKTKYPLKKMLKFAADGILSFSVVPLKLSSALGFLCAFLSFVLIIYGLIIKIFFPTTTIPGWASLFIVILFLGGVQLICIGILGEYLGRVYDETKKRPLYVIDEEINFDKR